MAPGAAVEERIEGAERTVQPRASGLDTELEGGTGELAARSVRPARTTRW